MVLQAIKYERGKLHILDQLKLPYQKVFLEINGPQAAWDAIKMMQVRGAPAIAIVAALSLAVWLDSYLREADENTECEFSHPYDMAQYLRARLAFLVTSRPTAVNLSDAARKLEKVIFKISQEPNASARSVAEVYIAAAEHMLTDDVQDNGRIGQHGAKWLLNSLNHSEKKISALTHCNTGYVQLISPLSFHHIFTNLLGFSKL